MWTLDSFLHNSKIQGHVARKKKKEEGVGTLRNFITTKKVNANFHGKKHGLLCKCWVKKWAKKWWNDGEIFWLVYFAQYGFEVVYWIKHPLLLLLFSLKKTALLLNLKKRREELSGGFFVCYLCRKFNYIYTVRAEPRRIGGSILP